MTTAPAGLVAAVVIGPGTDVNVGASVSGGAIWFTVTVKVTWEVLGGLAESVAEHVTTVGPIGKVVPDAGLQETGRLPSTRSLAVNGP